MNNLSLKKYIFLHIWRDFFVSCHRYFFYPFYHYSGLAFIVAKARSNKNEDDHPSLVIWLFSVYFALFGMVVQRYDSHLSRFDSTLSMLMSQIGTSARHSTFTALASLQHYRLPAEPFVTNPVNIVSAFLGQSTPISEQDDHQDKVTYIAKIILNYKEELGCEEIEGKKSKETEKCRGINLHRVDFRNLFLMGINLNKATLTNSNFSKANFSKAKFRKADLSMSNLGEAYFGFSDFSGADLTGSNLGEANFQGAKLIGAKLIGANFYRVNLRGADVKNADFRRFGPWWDFRSTYQLINPFKLPDKQFLAKKLTCDQLKQAENWEEAYRDKELGCGKPIPTPPPTLWKQP